MGTVPGTRTGALHKSGQENYQIGGCWEGWGPPQPTGPAIIIIITQGCSSGCTIGIAPASAPASAAASAGGQVAQADQ